MLSDGIRMLGVTQDVFSGSDMYYADPAQILSQQQVGHDL